MNVEELVTNQIGGVTGVKPYPCLYFEWTGEKSQAVRRAWISNDKQIKEVEEKPNFRRWLSRDDLDQLNEKMRIRKLGISEEAYEKAKQKLAEKNK